MLKALVKKQPMEIFRMYLYDTKKNRSRSRGRILFSFILFGFLMVGVLGGVFAGLSIAICAPLNSAGMGWMYFMLIGVLSVFLGAFGSVFNTYSGLYLSKDNDLLLALPIPVRTIMSARLMGVYLMGLMYSAVVSVPAVIVYLCVASFSISALIGGVVYVFMISLFVLVLSCALGWVVAKISLKLKHKSFMTVVLSLAFIGLYYFFYFKAQEVIADVVANAAVYGTAIRAKFQPLYVFGNAATGDWTSIALFSAFTLLLFAITALVLERSFLSIATSTGKTSRVQYHEKRAKLRSLPRTMLAKEFRRFTASPNYMLNCGLSTLFLPLAAVAVVWKGGDLISTATLLFEGETAALPVLLAAAICLIASMNDSAAPSVSLEGKNLWLAQSLPILPWQALAAKLRLQIALTSVPTLICAICVAAVSGGTAVEAVLFVVCAVLFTVMMAAFGLFLGIKMPNLNWTTEIMPIKQSAGVTFALLGGWAYSAALAGLFLWIGWRMGAAAYLAAAVAVTGLLFAVLLAWLKRWGAQIFAAL